MDTPQIELDRVRILREHHNSVEVTFIIEVNDTDGCGGHLFSVSRIGLPLNPSGQGFLVSEDIRDEAMSSAMEMYEKLMEERQEIFRAPSFSKKSGLVIEPKPVGMTATEVVQRQEEQERDVESVFAKAKDALDNAVINMAVEMQSRYPNRGVCKYGAAARVLREVQAHILNGDDPSEALDKLKEVVHYLEANEKDPNQAELPL